MTAKLIERLKAILAKYQELAGAWMLVVMLVVGGVGIGSFITSYNDKAALTAKDVQYTAEVNRLQAILLVVLPKLMDKANTAVDSASSAATMATQAANDATTNAAVSKKRSENNMQEIRNGLAKTQSDIGKNNVTAKVMPESSRSKLNKLVEKSNSQLNR